MQPKDAWLAACSAVVSITMPVQCPNELLDGLAPKYQREELAGRDPEQATMSLAQASYLMTLCEELTKSWTTR